MFCWLTGSFLPAQENDKIEYYLLQGRLKLDKKPETKNERQLDSQEDNDILQDRSFSGHIKEFKIENNLKYAFNSRMTLSKDFQVKGIFRNYEPRVPNSKPPRVSPDPPHAPAPKQKVVI